MKRTISLSSHLGVTREILEQMGVFDATLGIDTELFVDPKLLVDSEIPEFKDSRKKILRYFAGLLQIHNQSHLAPRLRDKARDMLAVPEPEGLSIGYGSKSDNGTSISKSVANRILLSLSEVLAVGMNDAEVVELLGLFVPGFGSDSISDLIVHTIYEDFCAYTARVALELDVPTKEHLIEGKKYLLPTHPFSNQQLIFTPYSFLRPLPIATSYDEIAHAAAHNEELRNQLDEIIFPVLEETIKDVSEKSPEEIVAFKKDLASLLEIYKKVEVASYDLKKDDRGYYQIDPFVEREARNIGASTQPRTLPELIDAVRELVTVQFKRAIEDNGGNHLLYRKTDTGAVIKEKPHNEDVAQRLFYLIADVFCHKANILLSGESDAGRGPVDFSLGTAYDKKVLVEIKKSDNKNIGDGFREQVKAYERGENAQHSFYVVILVKEVKKKKDDDASQLDAIIALYEENLRNGIQTPELVIIDGLIHPSPSKLRTRRK